MDKYSDELKERVELTLSLLEGDFIDDFNYYITGEVKTKKSKTEDLGKTEEVKGKGKIEFKQSFIFDYYFEVKQVLTFNIFKSEKNLVATVNTSVGKIMGGRAQLRQLDLNSSEQSGKLQIQGQPNLLQ